MASDYGDSTAARSGGNGLAIAGLVCGLVGLIFFNIVLGPLAVIFGGVALNKSRKSGAPHRGMAIAGVVLGAVDIILFVVLIAVAATHGGHWYFNFGGK